MNKYKKALMALARLAFMGLDDNDNDNALFRQCFYRHLYAVGLIKFRGGEFIYDDEKARRKEQKELRKANKKLLKSWRKKSAVFSADSRVCEIVDEYARENSGNSCHDDAIDAQIYALNDICEVNKK